MIFAKESVIALLDEVEPLMRAHYLESCSHKDRLSLLPDWSYYVSMEECGVMHVFTARDEGVLVGYSAFSVVPHRNHSDKVVALNDVVFLSAHCRRGLAGSQFIDYCESELKKLGADMVTWSIKKSFDWSPIMYRKGYEDEEKVVVKFL